MTTFLSKFASSNNAIWLAAFIIALPAALLLGQESFRLWHTFKQPAPSVSVVSKTPAVTGQQSQRPASEIAAYHLFGVAGQEAEEEVPEDLPETNLRLTLRGIAATGADTIGGILIEGPDKKTDFYRVGDNLPGNATLHSVYATRVVLQRGGKLENLSFPEDVTTEGISEVELDDGQYENTPDSDYSDSQYPEPDYPEPDYGVNEDGSPIVQPEAPDNLQENMGNAFTAEGLDDARKEEVANRLRALRERMRAQNQ